MLDQIFIQIYALQIFEVLKKTNHTSDQDITNLWSDVKRLKESIQVGVDKFQDVNNISEEKRSKAKQDVKDIGAYLYQIGGIELMHLIFEIIVKENNDIDTAPILERWWDGVGSWLA